MFEYIFAPWLVINHCILTTLSKFSLNIHIISTKKVTSFFFCILFSYFCFQFSLCFPYSSQIFSEEVSSNFHMLIFLLEQLCLVLSRQTLETYITFQERVKNSGIVEGPQLAYCNRDHTSNSENINLHGLRTLSDYFLRVLYFRPH